ncbi:hypothetical protein [Pseudomonas sp. Irchel 3A5]|uniref:hypothetical protein n=1 Tax=Pseudomonas sp. Irchel 3A5 TaxID=2008911 RepID=UPI000BA2FDA9|nr:hypothetical protein [Pseudomonas sp. Irchel 3A5]
MKSLSRLLKLAAAYPPKWVFVALCAAIPIMFCKACDETPQLIEFLNAYVFECTSREVMVWGVVIWACALSNIRSIHGKPSKRVSEALQRLKRLKELEVTLEKNGLLLAHRYISEERRSLSDNLGFLAHSEETYRVIDQLSAVIRLFKR